MAQRSHSLLLLLSFLIVLSLFVSSGYGHNEQAKAYMNFQMSKFKGENPKMEKTNEFKVKEIDIKNIIKTRVCEDSKEKDRISTLPGQPHVTFSQYGGYVTVDQNAGRSLYYYFAEATNKKGSLPLLLWLNGGPGCSSLGFGAMQELGPFRVHSDGKTLFKNRYAWNHVANVLFLESPAGVGFSYSNRSSDYNKSGDKNTASDNYVFLLNWLEKFLEYKNRDFYIAGESYAGHFVPQLAHTILHHNSNSNHTFINLKGIMIGNAAINDETDTKGMYDYWGSHALISDKVASEIDKFCDFSLDYPQQDEGCNSAIIAAIDAIITIDRYNIYAPLCKDSNLTNTPKHNSLVSYDPCSINYVTAYLNRADVQKALHANVTKLKFQWESCSSLFKWNDGASTVIPLLQDFLKKGIRVWIFSGDIDGIVPVTSTQYSINKMNLESNTSWHAWFCDGEVGGYTEEYKGGLTFATVRGAGHQVPSSQPNRALSLVKHFLDGSPLPNSPTSFYNHY